MIAQLAHRRIVLTAALGRSYRFYVDNSFKDFHVAVMRSTDSDTDQDVTLTASFEYEKDGFECTMTVSWRNENNNDTTDYNMFAYSGVRSFGGFMNAHIETCGLTAYRSGSTAVASTAAAAAAVVPLDPPKDPVIITAITISARSPDLDTLPIPSTLNSSSYPLTNDYYTFSKRTVTVGRRKMLEVNMELSKPVANLVTFGIYKLPQAATEIAAVRRSGQTAR